jgi:hypothetical protein
MRPFLFSVGTLSNPNKCSGSGYGAVRPPPFLQSRRSAAYTKFSTYNHLQKPFRYPTPLTGTLYHPITY